MACVDIYVVDVMKAKGNTYVVVLQQDILISGELILHIPIPLDYTRDMLAGRVASCGESAKDTSQDQAADCLSSSLSQVGLVEGNLANPQV